MSIHVTIFCANPTSVSPTQWDPGQVTAGIIQKPVRLRIVIHTNIEYARLPSDEDFMFPGVQYDVE
ncbi:hypothetical protein PENNAL_c0004G07936 [Penicillium nalgiovense]|uniref:Uncharacterized protein n=1 Tax=Penicillium nalgiovense TaxID=60175 RepID=A0A1V6Z3W5_PENNA|nr:hypothetical protein PENNAL_c0004G07936 [Penicillium nalgiovense]